KAFPAPRSTITRFSASPAIAFAAARKAFEVASSIALRTAGRLNTTWVTGPSRETRTGASEALISTSGSISAVGRLALLDHRADRFLLVVGVAGADHVENLQVHHVLQLRVLGVVEILLHVAIRDAGAICQLAGQSLRLRLEFAVRNDARDKSEAQ